MLDLKQMGVALRGARWKLNLTQGELAELAGVSRMTITNLEAGHTDARMTSVQSVLSQLGLELKIGRMKNKRKPRKQEEPPTAEEIKTIEAEW